MNLRDDLSREIGCPESSQTENLDLQRFDSSKFLILRGGIPRLMGKNARDSDAEILTLRILTLRIDTQIKQGKHI